MKKTPFLIALKACAASAAKQDVRYYLNGVLLSIDNYNLRIVGTDGHTLITVELKSEDTLLVTDGDFIIAEDDVKKVLKLFSAKDPAQNIRFELTSVDSIEYLTITDGLISFNMLPAVGKYPDWRLAVPKDNRQQETLTKAGYSTGVEFGMNLSYLERIGKALQPLANKEFAGSRVHILDANSSALFTPSIDPDLADDITEVKAVIMPMRL